MDALAFLQSIAESQPRPIYVLSGDENFLRNRCREAIIALLLPNADPSFSITSFAPTHPDFSTIRNELDTLTFFSPIRIVVVEQAEKFITDHRDALEKYAQAPSTTGVLILEPSTFPETTKLAKALPAASKIVCKSPKEELLPEWCSSWAKSAFQKKLSKPTAGFLVQRVGPSMGLLAQEIEKVAVAIGSQTEITEADIERLVGRSREASVFDIMDAVGMGQPAKAFAVLHRLFDEGEDALAILGGLTWQLRKLASVGRALKLGHSIGAAMDAAGVSRWPVARESLERQAKHLGLRRLNQLTDWLVEVNLGLKGGSQLTPRMQMELLLTKLAKPRG